MKYNFNLSRNIFRKYIKRISQIIGITFSICLILLSCSTNKKLNLPKYKDLIIFPSPPDTTRIQFLTTISSSSDVNAKLPFFKRFILGESPSFAIMKPYGIAVHNSKIYVCDAGVKGLEIFDLKKQTFQLFAPKGKGELKLPINCFVDDKENLYVADADRHQVVIFDKYGNYINSIGGEENTKPSDVSVYDNKIWVSDSKSNKIKVYKNQDNYELLFSFPDSEQGKEDFLYSPINIFVNKEKVYACDFGDFKIKEYDHEGRYITSVGSYGKNLGEFVRPKGIAVDRESNLYVVDAGFENVQIFNKDGKLLLFFGGAYTGPGYMWLPAKVTVDYDDNEYFKDYVDKSYDLKYLIFVTNQYGPDKISIYGAVKQKK